MHFIDWLRGPSRSMRDTYLYGPQRQLRYLVNYRMRGLGKLEFFADETDKAQDPRVDTPLEANYERQGRDQADYLIANGLKPTDTLLDYGCGPMRAGPHLIKHLSAGTYVAADISRRFMQRGVRNLERHKIARHDYHLINIRDQDVTDLYGFTFDFAWSFSALQYVSDDHFSRILKGLRGQLRGPFLFSVAPAESQQDIRAKRQYYRDWKRTEEILNHCGYTGTLDEDGLGSTPIAHAVPNLSS